MLEIKPDPYQSKQPKVYVVGVGGGGNNAVNRISSRLTYPVSYFAINTDEAVLNSSVVENRIQIGQKLTKGFGTGGDAEIGRGAAEESDEDIFEELRDANMVILTCGMGGGTGTGATPIVAKMCKDVGILTVAVVTTPFSFESKPRYAQAEVGLEQLRQHVDMLITIRNDRLIEMSEKPIIVETAFMEADEVLAQVIEGITSIIFRIGTVNLDFNDLASTLRDSGDGYLGIGRGSADESVVDIVRRAIESPLMEGDFSGADRILINTSGSIDLRQLNEAVQYIKGLVSENASIMWGTVDNSDDKEQIIVTFIASGISLWNHRIEPILRNKIQTRTPINIGLQENAGDFSQIIRDFKAGINEASVKPFANNRDLKVPPESLRAHSVEVEGTVQDSSNASTNQYQSLSALSVTQQDGPVIPDVLRQRKKM